MRSRIVAITIAGALLIAGGVAFATEGRGAGINGNPAVENGGEQIIVQPVLNTISAGGSSSFAITPDGVLWGWGHNDRGQLGDGTTTDRRSPVKIMDDVISVSASGRHTMAIRSDGSLWGWGWNHDGEIGDGTREVRQARLSPVKIMDDVAIVAVGVGRTMAIRSNGSLYGWGSCSLALAMPGERTHRPVHVMDNVIDVSLGGGFGHSTIIKSDGSLWIWGQNQHGQLGDGTRTNQYSPIKIMDDVTAVSAGSNYTMAIKSDGSLWGWGINDFLNVSNQFVLSTSTSNQSGIGTIMLSSVPWQPVSGVVSEPVLIMDDVISVSAGLNHTMAIRGDDSLWVWGVNEIGDVLRYPIKVMDNIVAVSAGWGHSMAVKSDGSLWTWGHNAHGQLGDGTRENSNSPIQIMDNVKLPTFANSND